MKDKYFDHKITLLNIFAGFDEDKEEYFVRDRETLEYTAFDTQASFLKYLHNRWMALTELHDELGGE